MGNVPVLNVSTATNKYTTVRTKSVTFAICRSNIKRKGVIMRATVTITGNSSMAGLRKTAGSNLCM